MALLFYDSFKLFLKQVELVGNEAVLIVCKYCIHQSYATHVSSIYINDVTYTQV